MPRLPLLLTVTVLAAAAASAQVLTSAPGATAPATAAPLAVAVEPGALEVPAGEARQAALVIQNPAASAVDVMVRAVAGHGWDVTPFERSLRVEGASSARAALLVTAPPNGGGTVVKVVVTDVQGRFLGGAVAPALTPEAMPAPPADEGTTRPPDPLAQAQGQVAPPSGLPGGLPPEALGGGLLALLGGALVFALRAKEDDRLDFAGFLRENLGKIAKSFGKRGTLRRQ